MTYGTSIIRSLTWRTVTCCSPYHIETGGLNHRPAAEANPRGPFSILKSVSFPGVELIQAEFVGHHLGEGQRIDMGGELLTHLEDGPGTSHPTQNAIGNRHS